MKKLACAAIAAIFLTVNIASAQSDAAKPASTSTPTQAATKTTPKCDMKNCCMMKAGKMVCVKDGKEMAMTDDMKCSNGTVCMKDGKCTMADGTATTLKNGDCIDMNGMVCKAPAPKKAAPKTTEKTDPAAK